MFERWRLAARVAAWGVVLVAGVWLARPVAAQTLDLSKPEDAVKADRKIQCSLTDGEAVTMAWQGTAYSRVSGERDRKLFGLLGMNVRACTTVRDAQGTYGYRMVSREIMLYLDPQTGQILRTWKNPWTGKEVEVIHVSNDPVNSRPTFARANGKDYVFQGTVRNGLVLMGIEVPLFYTNPLAGDYQEYVGGTYQAMELFYFTALESQVRDAKPGVDQLGIGWTRVAKWLPWMEMGDLAGQMIVSSTGTRLRSWSELPDLLKAEIEKNYPAYKTPPPLDDARPNETSWSFFKKQIDGKRKK